MNRATGLATGLDPPAPRRRPAAARRRSGPCSTPSGGPGPASGCCCSGSTSSAWTGRSATQHFRRERYLPPQEALGGCCATPRSCACRRRSPGRVRGGGGFEAALGAACDTDMWMRLFSRYGVRCVPQTTCAYTVHEAATTTGMWNQETVRACLRIFDRAVARSCPRARSVAGRPTSSTSSSLAAPTGVCGCGSAPRPAACSGCSTCRRSAPRRLATMVPVRAAFVAAAGTRRPA